MDAYELFVRYQEQKYIPDPYVIHQLFIQGKVRTIELIALMYEMKGEKIQMNQVYAHSPKACMEMAETVLTPIVVRNSEFKDVDSSVQSILATYSAMEMATPEKKSISEAITPEARTRPSTPETKTPDKESEALTPETKTPDKEPPELISEALTEMILPKIVPKRIVGPSKTVCNFVIKCDEFFMNKSKTRIKSMTTALKCRKKMSWVRAVASKLETKETYSPGKYEALRKSDRHIHRTGHEVSDFVRALADTKAKVKTFSWSLKDDEAVLIQKCREALQKRCSTNKPEQYLPLAMLVCSIGLPTFQLYTPCSFFKKWRRFKDVTNDNVVKALLRPGGDVKTLLDEYSPADVVVDGEPGTVELFMFKYWYSYPTKVMLSRLVEYANANLERCLGINDIE